MSRDGCSCCFFVLIIINIILVGVSIDYTIKYTNSQKYNKLKCNITKIEYPTEIPNTIDEYNNNFVKCSCGKRCTSDMGICTKLFITNKNLEEVLLQKEYGIYDSECTFAETKCVNGEIIENRINAIQENIDYITKQYGEYITGLKLLNCYEFNGIYFLDDYNYFDEMILCWSIMGFIVILLFTICRNCPPG